MNRHEFHLKFGSKNPIVLPVIHVLNYEQTHRNIVIAMEGGCPGVFLINHDFEKEKLLPILPATPTFKPAPFKIWCNNNVVVVFPFGGNLVNYFPALPSFIIIY